MVLVDHAIYRANLLSFSNKRSSLFFPLNAFVCLFVFINSTSFSILKR